MVYLYMHGCILYKCVHSVVLSETANGKHSTFLKSSQMYIPQAVCVIRKKFFIFTARQSISSPFALQSMVLYRKDEPLRNINAFRMLSFFIGIWI